MKYLLSTLALCILFVTAPASAQGVNLTGPYRCVQLCRDGLVGQPAFITQNGWNLSLLNEAGGAIPGLGVDWVGHIWVDSWNQGAIFSPDGFVVQFDSRNSMAARPLARLSRPRR